MEWTELVGFALTAIIAVFGSYSATKRGFDERERRNELNQAQQAADIARLEAKMDALKAEVERHNQVIERTYKLENSVGALETNVAGLYHRYDEIKEKL